MTLDDRGRPPAAPGDRQFDQKSRLKSPKIGSHKISYCCSVGDPGALHDHYKPSEDLHNHVLSFLSVVDAFSPPFQSEIPEII